MARKPRTIDEYLAALSEDKRAALEKLRKTIRSAAPKAEECISYQIAAFRQNGMLVGFGATATHCAFYLMSATTVGPTRASSRTTTPARAPSAFKRTTPCPPPW